MSAEQPNAHASRYVGVALLSAIISNVVLIGGDRAGLGYTAAMALSWLVTGTFAYLLHARLTFRRALSTVSWLRFLAGAATGFPLAWLLIEFFGRVLHWPMIAAAPAATIIMFGYNYVSARFAITRTLVGFNRSV